MAWSPCGLGAGGKPVGQFGEVEAAPTGLALGPLVPVEPDLGRIGEVGADLDEAESEVAIVDVEVGTSRPGARSCSQSNQGAPAAAGLLGGAEDPLELLGGHDGHHPEASLVLSGLEIGMDMVELAVVPAGAIGLLEMQDRDVVVLGEVGPTSRPKRFPIFWMMIGEAMGWPRWSLAETLRPGCRPGDWGCTRSGRAGPRTRCRGPRDPRARH